MQGGGGGGGRDTRLISNSLSYGNVAVDGIIVSCRERKRKRRKKCKKEKHGELGDSFARGRVFIILTSCLMLTRPYYATNCAACFV